MLLSLHCTVLTLCYFWTSANLQWPYFFGWLKIIVVMIYRDVKKFQELLSWIILVVYCLLDHGSKRRKRQKQMQMTRSAFCLEHSMAVWSKCFLLQIIADAMFLGTNRFVGTHRVNTVVSYGCSVCILLRLILGILDIYNLNERLCAHAFHSSGRLTGKCNTSCLPSYFKKPCAWTANYWKYINVLTS